MTAYFSVQSFTTKQPPLLLLLLCHCILYKPWHMHQNTVTVGAMNMYFKWQMPANVYTQREGLHWAVGGKASLLLFVFVIFREISQVERGIHTY